jgi:hypothetical protein
MEARVDARDPLQGCADIRFCRPRRLRDQWRGRGNPKSGGNDQATHRTPSF